MAFRPFFLLAGAWATIAVPVWLAAFVHGYALRGPMDALSWHAHEMVHGYGMAAVAGFLLTAIPNWTGRLPVRGAALGALALLWLAGRVAVLASGMLGAPATAAIDLAFPLAFAAVVARELVTGRNWRNLPMLAGLAVLFASSLLVHLQSLGLTETARLGHRLGIGALLAMIALVGGRIVPSFTRNWLARQRPQPPLPAAADRLDAACLALTVLGLGAWVFAPSHPASAALQLAGGLAAGLRLARWRGLRTLAEPLVFVLHAGYGWLAFGLAFLGLNGLAGWFSSSAPLHALTVGAIGTMTLAVMTRASLGHSGQPLHAGRATVAAYALVSLAALLRIAASTGTGEMVVLTSLSGLAWVGAFATFTLAYAPLLLGRRAG